ncbi:DUF6509 family protein [Paenibacillus methanolicus]|uniref:Pullulanase n=1 Tax=Paenibacillus methanolicus TaxID=582686 RepID=A0A5S5CLN9_9BACL|nr:DUF6509 family protein [Paenibacillus methanolicus]TYP79615.1 hypothetical protein BCM02_101735 [Paenibacillus methanolicus]
MLTISSYSAELVKDPFGILPGTRYEFVLNLDIPDDDELHHELGVYARVVYKEQDGEGAIVKYDLHERSTDRYLDFDLEDEEVAILLSFCKERTAEAEGS